MHEGRWLAAYIYVVEPWETLLEAAVAPLVARVFEQGWAERWFFIRYWERGPHLRLRFFGDPVTLEEKLKPELDRVLTDYLKRHPTRRFDHETPNPDFFPNDSLQYIEYEPEVERYGGPVGMGISERQFEASSRAVLAAIDEPAGWGYEKALGIAIQMHFCFAHALEMDLEQLAAFCHYISRGWLRRAYAWTPEMTRDEHQAQRTEVLKAFAEMFEKQKEVLVPFASLLWQGLEEEALFESGWLNEWVREMREIGVSLEEAHRADELVLDGPMHRYVATIEPHTRGQALWGIIESYVHMTNNRLGILNQDEAYLGYLIGQTIPYLRGEKRLEE